MTEHFLARSGQVPADRRVSLTKVYLRLPEAELEAIDRTAADLRIPRASAARRLIADGAAVRAAGQVGRTQEPTTGELELHLLVAIEQVLALMESFLPQGPGAARGVLPIAVRAAQDRLDAADEEGDR